MCPLQGEAPLPLFAAADRAAVAGSVKGIEPAVALRPLTDGREVIEDYRNLQLSLRAHPLSFVRDELSRQGVRSCADLSTIRDGRHVEVAGIIEVSPRKDLARKFLAFMMGPGFQDQIPTTNWMFPAGATSGPLPPAFEALVTPEKTLIFTPEEVDQNRRAWIDEWLNATAQ